METESRKIEPSNPDRLLTARHLRPNKRQHLRDEKILNLLNATVRVLARDGHAKLSLRSVASEAGVSLSSLQHYFETRDALVNEAARAFLVAYLERYTSFRLNSDLSPSGALNAIFEDIVREARKVRTAAIYFEIWALARHDETMGLLVVETYNQYVALFAHLLRAIEPRLAEKHVQNIAALIAAESEGLVVVTHYSTARDLQSEGLVEQMCRNWAAIIDAQIRAYTSDN